MHVFVFQRLQKCFGFRGCCPLTPRGALTHRHPLGAHPPDPLAPSFFELFRTLTFVLAKSFALFLAKKFAPQFLPSWMALSSHFPLPKTLHFSKRFAFFALSNGMTDRGPKQQIKRSNFRLHVEKIEKLNQIIPKTIGNRKRDCAWGGSGW